MTMKSLAAGLSTLLLMGALVGCGGDDTPTIFLRPLDPDVKRLTIPVGTTMKVIVRLSSIPATDVFVDIDNAYKEFVTTNPADSLRFQPKDDPPEKTIEVKAIKANTDALPLIFSLRDTSSTRTINIVPEALP